MAPAMEHDEADPMGYRRPWSAGCSAARGSPRDRDDDIRDIEMPWTELRDEPGRDREPEHSRDSDDVRDRDRGTRERVTIREMYSSMASNYPADSNGRS